VLKASIQNLKVLDSLLFGFSNLKTFSLLSNSPPCHSARNRRRSRRIHHPK